MKTETKLFKYVQKDNFRNVKSILLPTHNKSRKLSIADLKLKDDVSISDKGERDNDSLLDVENVETINHVNINCQDSETGYTPLMWAVLNGNMDMAALLIHFNSNVNITDYKGNTVLHLAAFCSRSDMVEILLNRGADVNVSNHDGNTPLHIACQNCITDNKFILLKLLRANPDVTKSNKDGSTPLDLAAQYGRIDALSMLLDHAPPLRGSTRAFVEAAIRGHSKVLELMLDYGIDPNIVDEILQTTALHEACRYLRFEAAKILLSYGANPAFLNVKNEMPKAILATYPGEKVDDFLKLFQEWETKPKVKAKYVEDEDEYKKANNENNSSLQDAFNKESKYPVLRNNSAWTEARSGFCSGWDIESPNTTLLDGDNETFWTAPESSSCWVCFDFRRPFIITGIRLWGWDSDRMPRLCKLQRAFGLNGEWQDVLTFECNRKGSQNLDDPGVAQEFHGMEVTSRFWRLYVKDNHGGSSTTLHSIEFFGVDTCVTQCLTSSNVLERWKDVFIQKGFNIIEDLFNLDFTELSKIVRDIKETARVSDDIKDFRLEAFPITYLNWLENPVERAYVGITTPGFSVQSDSAIAEDLELLLERNDETIHLGRSRLQSVHDECDDSNRRNESFASFSGINLNQEGDYLLVVRSKTFPSVFTSAPISVVPNRQSDLDAAFAELEKLLQF